MKLQLVSFALFVIFISTGVEAKVITGLNALGCQTYHASAISMDFNTAINFCRQSGLKLATPDTPTKYKCMTDALRNSGSKHAYWIAASDDHSHKYVWKTTGEVADMNGRWDVAAGQPNGHPEHCAVIYASNTLLHDYKCIHKHRCICESS